MFRAVVSGQRCAAVVLLWFSSVFTCCGGIFAAAVSAAEPPVTAGLKLHLDAGKTAAADGCGGRLETGCRRFDVARRDVERCDISGRGSVSAAACCAGWRRLGVAI